MGPENAPLSAIKELEIYLFGITFPIAFILCILILVQRIRRRVWGGRFAAAPAAAAAAPKRQMDPHPSNDGGKERADGVGHDPSREGRQAPYSREVTAALPSACDILQPLSHFTALPSSGYLAAVLGRERRARAGATNTTTAQACLAEGEEVLGPSSSAADPPPHANPTPAPGGCGGGTRSIEHAWSDLTAAAPPTSSSRSGSSDESFAELEDPQSLVFSPTGWRQDDLPELALGVSQAGEPQPVQKRSHTVQQLYGVDSEGARMWRRAMLEYS
ncbi:hypothetical protein BDV59DRAFT_199872 [Aspergillus ambiguus]|uniref:uncharacterized protein n=1 Tax=Aspergillus ambiguus TaxID=176160 RepID=UPI003CCCF410